jgi:hypothetical protein
MPPILSPIAPRIGTRAHNLALALGYVASSPGSISRAGISERTGLNRSTTSSLIDELIAGGLVREVGETNRAGVGRPGTALALCADGPAGLGLDLTAAGSVACVVDLSGRIRFHRTTTGDGRSTSRLTRSAVAAATRGNMILCGTVVVDSQAGFAALAEDDLLRAGESYLYVDARETIGAALVVDGRLYRGRHHTAGDISHVRVDPNGPRCRCGHRGCLTLYAGPEAIRTARDHPHPAALAEAGTFLGTVLAGYLTLLDLDRIVLGGLYRDQFRAIAPEIQKTVTAPVVRATHGSEAPALGAARSAVREVIADPTNWLSR